LTFAGTGIDIRTSNGTTAFSSRNGINNVQSSKISGTLEVTGIAVFDTTMSAVGAATFAGGASFGGSGSAVLQVSIPAAFVAAATFSSGASFGGSSDKNFQVSIPSSFVANTTFSAVVTFGGSGGGLNSSVASSFTALTSFSGGVSVGGIGGTLMVSVPIVYTDALTAANDTAAATAGVPVNGIYKDSSGALRIRVT
jgi:hypothetical protein